MTRARDDRAGRGLRRRVDDDDGRADRRTGTSFAARRAGSRTAASASCYVVFATVAPGTRSQGHHGVRRREGRCRPLVRRADEEDGPARDRQRRDLPRGLRRSGGPPARRRGPGLLRAHAHVRPAPASCWARPRPGSPAPPRVRRRVRGDARAVRQADRRAPGGRVPPRRHGRCGSRRRGSSCGGPPARSTPGEPAPEGGCDGEAPRVRRPRCGAPGRPSRRWAAGATPASTRSRSGCATPSSRRSRRARPTSSA